MVSLLDSVSFMKDLGIFAVLIPFIFIFAVTYGMLLKTQPFGDDKTINGVVAFTIAFISLHMMPVLNFIQLVIPYLFALFMIIVLVLILFNFMGVKEDSMKESFEHPAVYGTIIGLILLGIFVFTSSSFDATSPGQTTDTDQLSFKSNLQTGETKQATSIITETDEGPVTIVPQSDSGGSSGATDQEFLRNTIFHPTIMGMFVLLIVFATATWMIMIVKEEG